MSDDLDVIRAAQALVDSLYDNAHLSVDQHAGISAGLGATNKLGRDRDQWRAGHEGMTRALREIAESAGVVFESSRDQDGFERWAWRYGDTEYHPGSVAEGGAAFGAIRYICAAFVQQRAQASAVESAARAVIEAWAAIEAATPLDLDLSALAVTLGDVQRQRKESTS